MRPSLVDRDPAECTTGGPSVTDSTFHYSIVRDVIGAFPHKRLAGVWHVLNLGDVAAKNYSDVEWGRVEGLEDPVTQ